MNYTEKDVEIFAKKHNISTKEAVEEIDRLIDERKNTNLGIDNTIERNGYVRFPNDLNIFGYGKNGELNSKYICYTPNIQQILSMDKNSVSVVTGFGATNAPTIGTLSMILKAIEFQKQTGLYTYIIINDLGSINARKIDVNKVLDLTEHFKHFIIKMGFDLSNGEIRTHNNLDHARVFSLVSSVIKLSDFGDNTEATDKTYERLNLRGNDFSAMVDHVFTATDCLLPIIKDGRKAIVVPCGLEEFYHANIGAIAIQRMMQIDGLKDLIPQDVQVGAVYSKLIDGLFPYFKQSKSIPDSSVALSDTKEQMYNKIVNCSQLDEPTILQMILQSTNWNNQKMQLAVEAFNNLQNNYSTWQNIKKEYVEWLYKIKEIWDSFVPNKKTIKEKIFY